MRAILLFLISCFCAQYILASENELHIKKAVGLALLKKAEELHSTAINMQKFLKSQANNSLLAPLCELKDYHRTKAYLDELRSHSNVGKYMIDYLAEINDAFSEQEFAPLLEMLIDSQKEKITQTYKPLDSGKKSATITEAVIQEVRAVTTYELLELVDVQVEASALLYSNIGLFFSLTASDIEDQTLARSPETGAITKKQFEMHLQVWLKNIEGKKIPIFLLRSIASHFYRWNLELLDKCFDEPQGLQT